MNDKFSGLINFFKKTWFFFLIAALFVVAGVSSVEIIKEEVLKIDTDTKYVESDSLYFSCEALDSLNPIVSSSEDTYYISKLIYDSLFDFDENLNVVPSLVEDYSVDTSRGMVKATLKKGITWHNGKKFTADDVRFTLYAINYYGSKGLYYDKASKIKYISIKSNYEIEIYFNNSYDASLDNLTFPIVCSKQYSNIGQFVAAKEDYKPVGTGEYQYQSYNYLKRLRLKPYEDYYGAVPTKKIQVLILPDKDLASNMLEISSVTCYVDRTSERRSIVVDKKLTMYDLPSNSVEFLVFNTYRASLKDSKIRKAVAYAVDEQEVLQNGYMDDGILTDTIYYPNFLGVEDENSYYSHSAEKSRSILNELGYEDTDENGILEDKNKQELNIKIVVNKENATRLAAAKIIKKNLRDIGIRATLSELPRKEYNYAIKNRDFDILVTGYKINEKYDLRSFFNGKNSWGYYNYQLSTDANNLERCNTAEGYQKIYSRLKEDLLDELPYYCLCYKKIGLVAIEGFKAEKMPMFNNIYKNCDTWYWTYAEEEKQEEKSQN